MMWLQSSLQATDIASKTWKGTVLNNVHHGWCSPWVLWICWCWEDAQIFWIWFLESCKDIYWDVIPTVLCVKWTFWMTSTWEAPWDVPDEIIGQMLGELFQHICATLLEMSHLLVYATECMLILLKTMKWSKTHDFNQPTDPQNTEGGGFQFMVFQKRSQQFWS